MTESRYSPKVVGRILVDRRSGGQAESAPQGSKGSRARRSNPLEEVRALPYIGRVRAEQRIFILSPATCNGPRSRLLLDRKSGFPLAARLRSGDASIGEVFSFLSGLYFRGKLAYARAFASPPDGLPGALVITPSRGLLPFDARLTLRDLESFARVSVGPRERRYRAPFERDLRLLAERMTPGCRAILLGSLATGKYLGILSRWLPGRLGFPAAFVGLGDMARGSLLLRSVSEGRELEYLFPEMDGGRG